LPTPWDESALHNYLLGTLPEANAETLEDACLRDDTLFEHLCVLERELIHSYLRGTLREPLLTRFEKVYRRIPARTRRLASEREWWEAARLARPARTSLFAKLAASLTDLLQSRSPVLAFAALTVLVAIALPVALWNRTTQLQRDMDQLRTAAIWMPERVVLAFDLAPGISRGSSAPRRLHIPHGTARVRLQLELSDAPRHAEYRAALRTVDGAEIWSGAAESTARTASVEIPAAVLAVTDYIVTLTSLDPRAAQDPAARYFFEIVE
jgi:hypothetical protein